MIRFIAAIDNKRGIADEHGIPWQGKIPGDIADYKAKIKTGTILMGYGVYRELSKPYEGRVNYVATTVPAIELPAGFKAVPDARKFLEAATEDVWNVGGALLFASTFDLADELYLTLINGDFNCTKFFPDYEADFEQVSSSEPITENGITYKFTVWKRKDS